MLKKRNWTLDQQKMNWVVSSGGDVGMLIFSSRSSTHLHLGHQATQDKDL